MRQIIPSLPAQLRTRLTGCIIESDDLFDLGQDMLQVELPNGVLISAGWYPESSPHGCYRVNVTRGLKYVVDPLWTLRADQAAEDVSQLAVRFSDVGFESESLSSITEYFPPSAYGRVMAYV